MFGTGLGNFSHTAVPSVLTLFIVQKSLSQLTLDSGMTRASEEWVDRCTHWLAGSLFWLGSCPREIILKRC